MIQDIFEVPKIDPVTGKINCIEVGQFNDILDHFCNIIANKNHLYNDVNPDTIESIIEYSKEDKSLDILVKDHADLKLIERKNLKHHQRILFSVADIETILREKYIF